MAQILGRWPANLTLSPEAAEELDRQSGERPTGAVKPYTENHEHASSYRFQRDKTFEKDADTGGASRFFPTFTPDTLCVLCGRPCVEPAGNPSSPSEAPSGSALSDVQDAPPPRSEASGLSSDTSARSAAESSRTTPPTDKATTSTVPPSADTQLAEWIVQLASSVAPLCKSCATSTAQSVALWLTDPTQASEAGAASTLGLSQQTLCRNLALIAAGSRLTGITPTTSALSSSFGSVSHATGDTTGESYSELGPARFRYQSKSSRGERNAGLDGFEERGAGVLQARTQEEGVYLEFTHSVPDGLGEWLREAREAAGLTLKAVAAHFPSRTGGLTGCVTNWEREFNRPTPEQWLKLREVLGFDGRYDEVMTTQHEVERELFDGRDRQTARNNHPTVKPIDLMRWLVRLVTPPGGTVLDPFMGSGTTGIAAHLESFDFIGIEREAEYADIAEARIRWWSQFPVGTDIDAALGLDSIDRATRATGQGSLLELGGEDA